MNFISLIIFMILNMYPKIILSSIEQNKIDFTEEDYNDLRRDFDLLQGTEPNIEKYSLDEWISYFINNLESNFSLFTYKINYEKSENVILYINNECTKSIKHYEVMYNSKKQTHDIMALIYYEGASNNEILFQAIHYEMNFVDSKKLRKNCYFLENSPSFKNLFFMMFDLTIKMIEKFKEQKNFESKTQKISNLLLKSKSLNESFYYMVKRYIYFCNQVILDKNKKNLVYNIYNHSSNCENILRKFLKNKIIDMYFWHQSSVSIKIESIYKISKCLYNFCTKRKIKYEKLMYYFYLNITETKNKLTQLTFIMFYVNFIKKEKYKLNFAQLSRIVVFISFLNRYKVKNTFEENDIFDIFVLIKNYGKCDNLTRLKSHMYCSYKSTIQEMHKIIIRRFLYFVLNIKFSYHEYILDAINSNVQCKTMSILIQYNIQIIYILFNFTL